jgi:uncharacterized membrane protein
LIKFQLGTSPNYSQAGDTALLCSGVPVYLPSNFTKRNKSYNNISMPILFTHLFTTFSAVFLGYYLYLFSKKPLEIQKNSVYILSALLVISAITGILLNPYRFGPFHALSVVTITTIPLALWQLSQSKYLKFKKGLLYNFIGLNIAMVGAFEPDRYVGRRLQLTETTWLAMFGISMIIGGYMVIKANRDSRFFR